ncbi:hypothetical protein EYW00_10470 [Leptospira interrogans serovar Copenhageni]|nr:hypothetical protein F3G11_09145 [Leptospira interrogans serovar Copenhageni]NUL41841.1 hypothetical protein [Leptospira interrogans serovar Copenhageni]QOI45576.1 hypothetical protein Lepto898_01730 [Leptospira interrogans serovar Icterohaemorrhagiae]WPM71384.1 hypothetical protein FYB70_01730 [Leptospira interrogans serovar Icterohaemorrhagiae]
MIVSTTYNEVYVSSTKFKICVSSHILTKEFLFFDKIETSFIHFTQETLISKIESKPFLVIIRFKSLLPTSIWC